MNLQKIKQFTNIKKEVNEMTNRPLGIIRNIDNLGRIVIPKEVRVANKWGTSTPLEMFATEDGIFMREYGRELEIAKIIKELSDAEGFSTNDAVQSAIQHAKEYLAKA